MNKNSLLILGCSLVLFRCQSDKQAGEKQDSGLSRELIREVHLSKAVLAEIELQTIMVNRQNLQIRLTIPATLKSDPNHVARIGSPVAGQVQKVLVDVGDHVRKGQILAYMIGQEIGEIAAQYIQAKAQWLFSRSALERQKLLQEQNATAKKSLLEAQAEFEKAQAEYDAQHSRLHSIGIEETELAGSIEKSLTGEHHNSLQLPIFSPISGIVVERNAVIGQTADPATPLLKILDPAYLWAEGAVYENDWHKVHVPVSVRFSCSSTPNVFFDGTLVYIAPMLNEETRTSTVRVRIPNLKGRLAPNMFGCLIIPLEQPNQVIAIPEESLVEFDNQPFVFIVVNDTTFVPRSVGRGMVSDSLIEIIRGLEPGERVVSRGAFLLKSEILKDAFAGEGD
jgi:membrane fusion protein, heavy metal efflux system